MSKNRTNAKESKKPPQRTAKEKKAAKKMHKKSERLFKDLE